MSRKIRVSDVGCCLVDKLYTKVDFNGPILKPYLSKENGDGGLVPGQLVFVEEFENFARKDFEYILDKIVDGKAPDKINVGGPAIVALINVAQILNKKDFEIKFYGKAGNDEAGDYLATQLEKTPVNIDNFLVSGEITPNTVVLSDPDFDNGHGERMFINSIATAWEMTPDDLDEEFFSSDFVVFGGTALTPNIHDRLTSLLKKAKSNDSITCVNTVYDFQNEKKNPHLKWPLGESDESYKNIDLLIMDMVEALRLSGKDNPEDAFLFFKEKEVSAFIITNGSQNITAFSDGRLFEKQDKLSLPVSQAVVEGLKQNTNGDTTGCGDNFAGGVIASLVQQVCSDDKQPDFTEACTWGIVSGGFSCFYLGGTYFEEMEGEKLVELKSLYELYKNQIRYLSNVKKKE
ncbi:MAG: carbohydrate kinase family protein [Bacteroidota bacterium]|nr:carbohydrate kinase family protein [Bacteroidota bacterium]